MLQNRQEELKRERADFDEERRTLRQQREQQWQKLTVLEGELQRFKAEKDVRRAELARLSASGAEDADAMRKEREAWRVREAELQQEISDFRDVVMNRQSDEAKREAEVHALKTQSEQRDHVSQPRLQIERLHVPEASEASEAALTFLVLRPARVREHASDDAGTLRVLQAGCVVRGRLAGSWAALGPGPGFARVAYRDGEPVLQQLRQGLG